MKNKLFALLFALLIFTTTSCSQNNSQPQEDNQNSVIETTELTEPPTENPLDGKTADDFVFTELEYQVPYHGSFLITEEKNNEQDTARCRLPQLDLEIGDASEINQEIHNELDRIFEYYKTIDPSVYYSGGRVDYLCYLNSSVLSLVIESRSTDTPNSYFYVYNIDVLTGKRLDNEELINLSTVSVNEAYGLLYNVIESKYTDIQGDWVSDEMLEDIKERSLSNSNIECSGFYFNNEGKLAVTYRYNWFAGAENYGDVCTLDASIKL